MYSLFIDTSETLVLGILDEMNGWVDYIDTGEKKGSGVIHGLIYQFLNSKNLTINQIDHLFLCAGPGSYTGMRLGEGIAQILELEKIQVFSCYHFEIPFILGVKQGLWSSKAFKGEVFIYEWNELENSKKLMKEVEFKEMLVSAKNNKISLYTHFYNKYFLNFNLTSDIIYKQENKLFNFLKKNKIRREPYYYRPLDLEFRPTIL